MIVEINALVQSVRTLSDLVKAGNAVRNAAEIASAIAEVQSQLLSAQSAALTSQEKQSTLSERIRELEKEVRELKDWNREAERYQLTEITPGIPAYMVKPGMENGEPAHYLCANCFARNQKSFLQHGAIRPEELNCAYCKSTFAPSEGRKISITRITRG